MNRIGSMIRMTPTEPSLFAQISRNPVVDRAAPQIGVMVQNRRGKQRDRIMSATSRKINQLFRDNSPEQLEDYHSLEEDANIYKIVMDKEMEQPAMSCSSDESETDI